MVLVFDATPLIYLGKVRILEKIKNFKTRKVIPVSVYQEVVKKGKFLGRDDAFYLDILIEENMFEILEVKQTKSLTTSNLSKADKDVLSAAKKLNGIAVMDEEAGRRIAEIEGIPTIGSVGILFNLLDKKIIDQKEIKQLIHQMIEQGWFCSVDLYSFIMRKLERG